MMSVFESMIEQINGGEAVPLGDYIIEHQELYPFLLSRIAQIQEQRRVMEHADTYEFVEHHGFDSDMNFEEGLDLRDPDYAYLVMLQWELEEVMIQVQEMMGLRAPRAEVQFINVFENEVEIPF